MYKRQLQELLHNQDKIQEYQILTTSDLMVVMEVDLQVAVEVVPEVLVELLEEAI